MERATEQSPGTTSPESSRDGQAPPRGLPILYLIEACASIAANFMMVGIFFFMQDQFKWQSRANLLLAATQGAVYVIGALAATPLSKIFGRRKLLRILNSILAMLALAGFFFPGEKSMAAMVLAYAMFAACQWPALESLVSSGPARLDLSRRISIYNLVWSGTGAITVAVSGTIIHFYPPGVLLLTCAMHAAALIFLSMPAMRGESIEAVHEHGAVSAEPQLLKMRTLAMRLSRVSLPATYAVLYSLGAMMPTLPVIKSFSPSLQTLVGSVWMTARFLAFVFLGVTSWWHTRPRALLVAAFIMLLSFLAITVRFSVLAPWLHLPGSIDPLVMIFSQIILGFAIGLIYCASLYFGMVLSQGSTEHGGYHEALIGLGTILGPGSGALAQFIRPGSQGAGIFAVTIVVWITVMLASVLSVQFRKM
jgi:MFS family permease